MSAPPRSEKWQTDAGRAGKRGDIPQQPVCVLPGPAVLSARRAEIMKIEQVQRRAAEAIQET